MPGPSKTKRSRKPKHPVFRVRSWAEYLDKVKSPKYNSWAFRGQSDEKWELWSTLPRFLGNRGIHSSHWRHQEWRSVEKFQSRAHHFLQHVPALDDTFQWLALMQHHGAPTRLIDFTWSPYVAAFFALENSTTNAAVWAINGAKITYQDLADQALDPHDFDPRRPGILRDRYLRNESDRVVVSEPTILIQRLVAQSGTFAIPATIERPINEILSDHPIPDDTIAKFILPKRIRREAIEDLRRMNILNATLFPGLDGLARSIGYDIEFHWAWDTTKRKPRG